MRAAINLAIANQETKHLVTRKIAGNDSLMDGVMKSISKLYIFSSQLSSQAVVCLYTINEELLRETNKIHDEIDKLEAVLEKKSNFVASQFEMDKIQVKINFSNSLCLTVVEYLTALDKLFSTIKLLHLAKCLQKQSDYFALMKKWQVRSNKVVGTLCHTHKEASLYLSLKEIHKLPLEEWPVSPDKLFIALTTDFCPLSFTKEKETFLETLKSKLNANEVLENNKEDEEQKERAA